MKPKFLKLFLLNFDEMNFVIDNSETIIDNKLTFVVFTHTLSNHCLRSKENS